MQYSYKSYIEKMKKIADLSGAAGVLSWDNEVYLPDNSAALRAQQMATLSGLIHEDFTSKELGKILNSLVTQKLPFKQKKNIEITLKDYSRDKKIPTSFVIKKSSIVSKAYHAWSAAKSKNDFNIFEAPLNELINHSRQEVDLLGYTDHPYNALIDLYEPQMTVGKLDIIFEDVKKHLVPFIASVKKNQKQSNEFLFQKFPKDLQWNFGIEVLKSMGFNFSKGRQDISSHPFTISFGAEDVRVTTRIDEKDLSNMVWSCIHEGGHALYEQGLNPNEYGLPSGTAASLGMHESQSRLWENNVGRSKEFWKYHLPKLKKYFPQQLKNIPLEQFFKAINFITPGKIRTEADELHYHLHVMIRYEIEKEIFQSKIKSKDIKALWNEKYKKYIGVTIKNDSEGILQDVHWSHGSFGYFPTYSLGSFYAAQLFDAAQNQITHLMESISKGDSSPLLSWLQDNVYRYGKTYNAEEICKKATGKSLDFNYFMNYIKKKYDV